MKNTNLIIGIIVLAAVGWFVLGGQLPAAQSTPGGGGFFNQGQQAVPAGVQVCNANLGTIPTPEGILSVKNAKVLSTYETNLLKADVFFKIGNADWTFDRTYTLSSDATIDSPAPVGQPVKGKAYIYLGSATTPGLDTTWGYSKEVLFDVPCLENFQIPTTIELIGALSPVAHNTDDSATNATGDQQDISAGQTVNLKYELKSNQDSNCWGASYYSNEYPVLAVVDMNQLVMSKLEFSSDFGPVPAGAPSGHSDSDVNRWYMSSYKLKNVQQVCEYNQVDGSIALTAHSARSPGATAVDDTGDVMRISYYAPQLYLDQDSGDWVVAYRNVRDGSQIIAPTTHTLYLN